ncbi:MAG: phosphoglucosamine mutase [Thermoplasmata archaeon]
MTKIFGTNGVRGVVNQDMNIDLAINLGKAMGTWLGKGTAAVGTDSRVSNEMLKYAVSSGLMATGVSVIDLGKAPTPAVQHYVRGKADMGVVITASHNPPEFNGIKAVAGDGTEFLNDVEEQIEDIFFSKKFNLVSWKDVGGMTKDDPLPAYHRAILDYVDLDSIKKAGLKVVIDCANGVGGLSTPYLLRKLGCQVITLNAQMDGTFPGHESEPTEKNLADLKKMVTNVGADLGIAHDGDSDRAIFFDEKGNFLHGDKTLTLMAKKMVKENGGGKVVTPVSSSSSVEDVVKENDGELIYTAVGSPIVARKMMEIGGIFGGEENGGLIFADHQYCRDAPMSAVRIVELMAKSGSPLSELIEELPKYALDKRGVFCPDEFKDELVHKLKEVFQDQNYDDTDGLKIVYPQGWVLIRPSGTEPKYRIYSQAKSMEQATTLGERHLKEVEKALADLESSV